MRLILTRHGQVDENYKQIPVAPESSLNQIGLDQSARLAERLCPERIDYLYHSPLPRAQQTAEIIAQEYPFKFTPNINYFADLRIGEFQDKEIEEIKKAFPLVKDFYQEILKKHSKDSVLVVTHASPLRLLIGNVLNLSLEDCLNKTERPANASISEFIVYPGGIYSGTVRMNCTKHLEQAKHF